MSALGSPSPLFLASAAASAAAGPIKSVRFNSGDSAFLSKTFSSNGNRRKWTWAGWVKRCTTDASNHDRWFAVSGTATDTCFFIGFADTDDKLSIQFGYVPNYKLITQAVFLDPSAWHHIVLAVDVGQSTASDKVKVYVNGVEQTSFSTDNRSSISDTDWGINKSGLQHQIGKSFTSYLNGYLADVYFIDGQQLDPTSFGAFDDNGVWQAAAYSGTFGTNGFHLFDFANESGIGDDSSGNDNDWTVNNLTLFSPNYANETTAASSGTVSNGTDNPYWIDFDPVDADLDYDSATGGMTRVHDGNTSSTEVYWVGNLGSSGNVKRARFDLRDFPTVTSVRVYGGFQAGYVNFKYRLLDSSKTEISGTEGTFGTIGWHDLTITGSPRYLEISCLHTSSTSTRHRLYGIEVNGTLLQNGSFSDIDVLRDVPANGTQTDTGEGGEVSGNYATFNPLALNSAVTLSNGNLEFNSGTVSSYKNTRSTIGVSSGKWYAEFQIVQHPITVGIALDQVPVDSTIGDSVYGWSYQTDGKVYHNNVGATYGDSWTKNLIIGLAFDADNRTAIWYKDGVSQGSYSLGSNAQAGDVFFFAVAGYYADRCIANFGQREWAFAAPSGYKALNTASLPTPTITDGSTAFDAVIYDGTDSAQTISGLNLSPDFLWLKNRTVATHHLLYDTVRGHTKYLQSSLAGTQGTHSSTQDLTGFTSDGFTLGGNVAGANRSSSSNIAWAWDAGANSSKTFTVKVVSDSGNKYRFDDFGTSAVTLDLEEGSTYVFDQSDSSNSGHPLRFSTTSDGTHNSGSEYTTGVTTTGTPGSSGAKTTIVVAASAPTLYYYCSAHSGMGGQANTNSTAGASNFDGSIQTTVRANQTAGFSIVSYTGVGTVGTTIGHGLNAAPEMIIIKNRDVAFDWVVGHQALDASAPWDKYLRLNKTDAVADSNVIWNDTAPTNSVFTVGGSSLTNDNTEAFIAYCFTPVAGYSALGSYEGLGGTGNPFIHTGFAVQYLIVKRTDSSGEWGINDAVRNTYNPASNALFADKSNTEDATRHVDLLSNGFKLRNSSPIYNSSGGDYIYMAFASNPFQANGGLAR